MTIERPKSEEEEKAEELKKRALSKGIMTRCPSCDAASNIRYTGTRYGLRLTSVLGAEDASKPAGMQELSVELEEDGRVVEDLSDLEKDPKFRKFLRGGRQKYNNMKKEDK